MDDPRKRRGSLLVEHRGEISENEGNDFDYVETNDDLSNISSAHNILSMERLKLSLDDRNAIEEEIHGVRCRAVEETPEFNQQSLQAFQNKLQSTPYPRRKLYDRIVASVAERRRAELFRSGDCSTQKHYATEDADFRLRFLRFTFFNVSAAVERFLNYLDLIDEFWGFEIVSQRLITRDDFSKAEYRHLKKGCIQILPFRDRSGRRIVVLTEDPSDPDYTKVDRRTIMKCAFYVMDAVSRDSVETQRKGIIWLSDPNAMHVQMKSHFPFFGKVTRSYPVRIAAGHHFFHDSVVFRLFETYLIALYKTRIIGPRVVSHNFYVGRTQLEMKYRLLGFGIPIDYIPWTDTGKIKVKFWNGWLKSRDLLESEHMKDRSLGIVECPGTNDVIFRHGQSYRKFQGNDALREWIETELSSRKMANSSLSQSYEQDNKLSIDNFCDRLIDEIKNKQNGRFLTWDNKWNVWMIISDEVNIKKKISASFYNFARRNSSSGVVQHQNSESVDRFRFIDKGGTFTTDLCAKNAFISCMDRKKAKRDGH